MATVSCQGVPQDRCEHQPAYCGTVGPQSHAHTASSTAGEHSGCPNASGYEVLHGAQCGIQMHHLGIWCYEHQSAKDGPVGADYFELFCVFIRFDSKLSAASALFWNPHRAACVPKNIVYEGQKSKAGPGRRKRQGKTGQDSRNSVGLLEHRIADQMSRDRATD